MTALFRPGTALLQRLRYSQQFTLIALSLVLPFAPLFALLAGDLDTAARLWPSALVLASTGLLVVCYLLAAFFLQLVSTVSLLSSNSRRMLAGDLGRATSLRCHDELGQVVHSFGEVASTIVRRDQELQDQNRYLETLLEERRRAADELRQARDAAEAANKAKSAFLANMSHELRTPLNAILGYSEMLQEEAEDFDAGALMPDLQKIHAAGKHLLALINDILDLSKIEAGKMDLYLETFDLRQMLDEVVQTIQPLTQQKRNRLVVHCDDDLGTMHADLTKVRQSLFNLLSNACKFTEDGTITLKARHSSFIVFEVSDTGIGMSSDQLARLFQPFTQADASTTRTYGGTGLGLAITRRFCQMMGGDVTVASEPGGGTSFTIELPSCVVDPKAPPRTDALDEMVPAPAAANTSPAVLIIDDDPATRDLMQRYLAREGYRVLSAAGGEAGLRMARELRPSAITLDVMMPAMDGWAVLGALKADPELAGIPVVMLTMMDDRSLGYALGASDFLTKPIERERLAAVLRRAGVPSEAPSEVLQ
ncbi:MAG: hypothetical protein RLZZ387_5487 [Chloroflexota bacterium]|jgi:signal transduction histidine kinase/ActR/RegA family two-component response regulator